MPQKASQSDILESLVSVWDPKSLFSALSEMDINPDWLFAGGFKKEARSLSKPSVRKKLARGLRKNPEILTAFLGHPEAPWHPQTECLDLLKTDVLRQCWRDLLRTPQSLLWAAALAADPREPLARRGHRILARKTPLTTRPVPEDSPILHLAPTGGQKPAANASAAPLASGTRKKLERQLEQANASLEKLRAEKKKWRQEVRSLLQKQTDKEKQLQETITDLQRALQTEKKVTGSRVETAISAYRQSLFGSEDTEAFLTAKVAAIRAENLKERTERTLQMQAEADRSFGNRFALENERKSLRQLLHSVHQAFARAIHPLPELITLRTRLQDRISEIEALLGTRSDDDTATGYLEEIIAQAPHGQTGKNLLDASEAFVSGPLGRELYSPPEKKELMDAIARRRKWLVTLENEALLARNPTPDKHSEQRALPKEIINVSLELQQSSTPPALLIDAYNLIKSRPFPDLESNRGAEAARNWLEAQLATCAGQFSMIRVVYDSRSLLKTNESRLGLDIVYARLRGDDQQADDEIVHFLESLRAERNPSSTPVWLVTDDQGLRFRSEPYCQGFIACEDMIRYLV